VTGSVALEITINCRWVLVAAMPHRSTSLYCLVSSCDKGAESCRELQAASYSSSPASQVPKSKLCKWMALLLLLCLDMTVSMHYFLSMC
jgi:hypothetical protein